MLGPLPKGKAPVQDYGNTDSGGGGEQRKHAEYETKTDLSRIT